MDDEEKLLGMMAIIEEQQEAIKHLAQSTAASHIHLQQHWLQQQDHLAKKHGEVISQYGGLFKKQLAELTERGNRWLDWKMLVASVATIGGCCLLVLAGATFYLSYLVGEITAAESELSGIEKNIQQLKAFNLAVTERIKQTRLAKEIIRGKEKFRQKFAHYKKERALQHELELELQRSKERERLRQQEWEMARRRTRRRDRGLER